MTGIIIAAVVVGAVGIGLGFFLSAMSRKFKVEVDETEARINELLPGNNCGACGFPGCSGAASAMAKGEAPPSICPVCGPAIAEELAKAVGGEVPTEDSKKVAFVKCAGDCDKSKKAYDYTGLNSCKAAAVTPNGGIKACTHGCDGFGDCVKSCEFDAIHIVNGIAVVDKEKCVACEMCVAACPKGLIEMIPYKSRVQVQCNSTDAAKQVLKVCDTGCIGCHLCEKACPLPETAIHVNDNLAKVDYDRCVSCGKCVTACPKNIIRLEPLKKKAAIKKKA